MPYLESQFKTSIDNGNVPTTPGELNYALTRLVIAYLNYKGLKYVNLNDVVGALECAKLEVYRRVAGPYEDKKIQSNGDVYPGELL